MKIRLYRIGKVTLEELEARLCAYMNAGAPEPILEGTVDERIVVFEHVARRGDSQMRSLMADSLKKLKAEQNSA